MLNWLRVMFESINFNNNFNLEVAERLGLQLAKRDLGRFSDGEINIRVTIELN